ncbi:hypothetical protein N8535_01325, partial [bacterium]|nr:hypothetical protein [bacterium]
SGNLLTVCVSLRPVFFFESFYLLADKISVPDEETRLIENSLVTGQNRPFNRIKLWQSTLQCLQSMM